MSNHVKSRRNPFNGPLASHPKTVGNTYGTRRNLQNTTSQKPTTIRKPVDKFNRPKTARRTTEKFNPKALYRKGSYDSPGAYKSAMLRHVEQGKARKKHFASRELAGTTQSIALKPSDNAMINFLDRIIATPSLHNTRNIRKSVTARRASSTEKPTSK